MRQLEDAWFFIHHLMERIWNHRFIYRDLNDLLSRNRKLEADMKEILEHKSTSFQMVLAHLCHAGSLDMSEQERQDTARHLVLQCTWWLSYAYVLQPRQALEEDNGPGTMVEATRSMLALCRPYALDSNRQTLDRLLAAYADK